MKREQVKNKCKVEQNFPLVNVHLENPRELARAIASGDVPVGAMGINLAFLKNWARTIYTHETHEHGLKITIQSLTGEK